jgi:hypothetical protein
MPVQIRYLCTAIENLISSKRLIPLADSNEIFVPFKRDEDGAYIYLYSAKESLVIRKGKEDLDSLLVKFASNHELRPNTFVYIPIDYHGPQFENSKILGYTPALLEILVNENKDIIVNTYSPTDGKEPYNYADVANKIKKSIAKNQDFVNVNQHPLKHMHNGGKKISAWLWIQIYVSCLLSKDTGFSRNTREQSVAYFEMKELFQQKKQPRHGVAHGGNKGQQSQFHGMKISKNNASPATQSFDTGESGWSMSGISNLYAVSDVSNEKDPQPAKISQTKKSLQSEKSSHTPNSQNKTTTKPGAANAQTKTTESSHAKIKTTMNTFRKTIKIDDEPRLIQDALDNIDHYLSVLEREKESHWRISLLGHLGGYKLNRIRAWRKNYKPDQTHNWQEFQSSIRDLTKKNWFLLFGTSTHRAKNLVNNIMANEPELGLRKKIV